MSSYLITNYKGKYTLQAEIDKNTNDFCRDKNGNLDNYSDIWIECAGKGKIFHYGKNILQYYINSLGRGHNILKAIYDGFIGSSDKFISITTSKDKFGNDKENKMFDYNSMYEELLSKNIIVDKVEETDEEILFKFKANNLEKLESILKPKTYCADRSPFSVRNLRKNLSKGRKKYTIPLEDLNDYKAITSVIPQSQIRLYIDLNNSFISKIASKSHNAESIKIEMKLSGLKAKEYFYSLGKDTWDKYLKFLKENIDKKLKENL